MNYKSIQVERSSTLKIILANIIMDILLSEYSVLDKSSVFSIVGGPVYKYKVHSPVRDIYIVAWWTGHVTSMAASVWQKWEFGSKQTIKSDREWPCLW